MAQIECPLQDGEVPDLILGSDKVVNNGTSCSPLGTQIFRVGIGLVIPVSVQCNRGWYQVINVSGT